MTARVQWQWHDRDIPPGAGSSIGAFGAAAAHAGTESYWSGQADGLLATTLIYDGGGWSSGCDGALPACGPGPLVGGSILWDGSRFVLFGGPGFNGSDVEPCDSTWVFDLGTGEWTEVCGGGSEAALNPRGDGLTLSQSHWHEEFLGNHFAHTDGLSLRNIHRLLHR